MRKNWQVACFILTIGWCGTSSALLIDRGGGMIYDSDLNITWLQDANYAQTSGYDADGRMTWNDAMVWADTLEYGGYTDWRLATYDASNPRPTTPTSANEMGSLWSQLSGGDFLTDAEFSPFYNRGVDPNYPGTHWYWTSSLESNSMAWRIDLGCACWDAQPLDREYFAWAVRDGDVGNVPEPTSALLFAAGLVGLRWSRRRR